MIIFPQGFQSPVHYTPNLYNMAKLHLKTKSLNKDILLCISQKITYLLTIYTFFYTHTQYLMRYPAILTQFFIYYDESKLGILIIYFIKVKLH